MQPHNPGKAFLHQQAINTLWTRKPSEAPVRSCYPFSTRANVAMRNKICGNRTGFITAMALIASLISACQPSPKYLSSREDLRNERIIDKAIYSLHRGEAANAPWEFASKLNRDNPEICNSTSDAIACQTRVTYTQRMFGPDPVERIYSMVVYADNSVCSARLILLHESDHLADTSPNHILFRKYGEKATTRTVVGRDAWVDILSSPSRFLETCNRLF